jgi:hypothetical protein
MITHGPIILSTEKKLSILSSYKKFRYPGSYSMDGIQIGCKKGWSIIQSTLNIGEYTLPLWKFDS